MNFSGFTDVELLNHFCIHKNKNAFGEFYQRHIQMVMMICMKYLKKNELAEDTAQHVFEKLFLSICNYTIENHKAWLYQTAKNQCLMELRKKNIEIHDSEKIDRTVHLENDKDNYEKILAKEKMFHDLFLALKNIDENQKDCILLFYIQKKSYKEIEEITGMDFNKVKSNIQNAKRNLRIIFQNKNDYEY